MQNNKEKIKKEKVGDKLTKILIGAVASSIVLVILLMVIMDSAATGTRSDFRRGFRSVLILMMTVSVIIQWVRYFRRYVDFAIERKLKDNNKETKN